MIDWSQVITLVGGSATFGTILLFLLKWLRFKKTDASAVSLKDAEAAKVQAEAYEIKTKADIGVADAALKVAQRLGEENEVTKKQLEKTQTDLEVALNSLRDATIKLHEVQHELNNEKQKNTLMSQEILELKTELNKLKNSQNGKVS